MKAKIKSNDFNRAIAATKDFVSGSDVNRFRNYIRLEFNATASSMTAMAVDGFRMSVEHAVCECDGDFVTHIHRSIKLPKNAEAHIEVTETETLIRCGGLIFGCPRIKREDPFDWRSALPAEPTFKIDFNGNYLLSALQAAKASCGGSLRQPVVLEFRGPIEPVILRTNDEDIKMVLPVRLSDKRK